MIPRSERSKKPPFIALAILGALAVSWEIHQWRRSHREPPAGVGTVARLTAHKLSPHTLGRAGDFVVTDQAGASVTVASSPDVKGRKPLLGALVDIAASPGDASDAVIWFRQIAFDAGQVVELPSRTPQSFECEGRRPGVSASGALGTGLSSELCSLGEGRFGLHTVAGALPDTAWVGDEINVTTTPIAVAEEGIAWDTEKDTRFVAFAAFGTAVLLEAPRMHVSRTFSHFGQETFPSPVLVRYGSEHSIDRTLRVMKGDLLSALSLVDGANRTLEISFGAARGGSVAILDERGRLLATGDVSPGEARVVRLPPGFGAHAALRDDRGVVTDAHVPLPGPGARTSVNAAPSPSQALSLSYVDRTGAPLPVHVLVKGLEGTPDPELRGNAPKTVYAGRSVYLTTGKGEVALSPGKYRVTASHGLAYSLSVRDVVVGAAPLPPLADALGQVIDTAGYLAADFHLHSAPSADSVVSLEERVQSLACEGVDLAVATDHNLVTDLRPATEALGLGDRLSTVSGVEITSAGTRWGHFNAFPLAVATGAPVDAAPLYWALRPEEMFASARRLGARVVQVNHARMDPQIGYFDQAHLDQKTGRADPVFSGDFNAFEAYNGMWIETLPKVREGAMDLVALARRGHRVAATGNSDSHRLLFEEAGYPRTWVHAPPAPLEGRAERTFTALAAFDTTVSSGPLVELTVDGKPPGSLVVPAGSGTVRVHVRVSAPGWVPVDAVEIWRDDLVVERFAVPGPASDGVRFERELDVDTRGRDITVLAWAESATPLPDVVPYDHALGIGFTGLVYVDGDRDGKLRVR